MHRQRNSSSHGRIAPRALALALVVALGAPVAAPAGATTSSASRLANCRVEMPTLEYARGHLTVATDNPVSAPWYVQNHPANGQGYEAGVVYAVASQLGIARHDVSWVVAPYASSYAAGKKAFDFDANEITYVKARARDVSFSSSYYDVHQAIVALTTNPIVTNHSPAQLRTYRYGDLAGTPGLAYITRYIHPRTATQSYSTMAALVAALKSGTIDALVIDTPTGNYMTTSQLVDASGNPFATVVGQFPSTGDHYSLVFQKGNPLVGCVDLALATLRANGTIASLTKRWLGDYTQVPTIKP